MSESHWRSVAPEILWPVGERWCSFFGWLHRNGHLLHNPAQRLAFPQPAQLLPHVLNESEVARLIETPDLQTAIGLRDRTLMETLYANGIRHSEAHKLDLYDIDTAALR